MRPKMFLFSCLPSLFFVPPLTAQNWKYNPNSKHYYKLTKPMTWSKAKMEAKRLGGHLATIRHSGENSWVFDNFLKFFPSGRKIFIGLNDQAREGTWVWESGEPVRYFNWGRGQPNNGNGNEDFVAMSKDTKGTWFDENGQVILPALIEKKGDVTTWLLEASKKGPPTRGGHGMVSINRPTQSAVFLFGGSKKSNLYSDTWRWVDESWKQLSPKNSPSPRSYFLMVYDSNRDRVVLFGGTDLKKSQLINETWEWDGKDWTLLKPLHSPSPRNSMAGAFDRKRGKVVIFGGSDGKKGLNETWEWDGKDWSQKKTVTTPLARVGSRMVYDSVNTTLFLFGGSNGQKGLLADSWAWNGAKWIPLISFGPVPPGRSFHSLAYDESRKKIILFGGGGKRGVLDDVWEWDGKNWDQETPLVSLSPRRGMELVYEKKLGRVFGFGGVNDSSYPQLTGTWSYTRMARFGKFGAACGGQPFVTLEKGVGSLPLLGKIFLLKVKNAPQQSISGILSLGLSKTFLGPFPLPLDLTSFGMPGCQLYQSMDLSWVFPISKGVGGIQLPIPNDSRVLGIKLYLQAMVLKSRTLLGGMLTSNAGEMVIWNK